jgi:hypothetical protein
VSDIDLPALVDLLGPTLVATASGTRDRRELWRWLDDPSYMPPEAQERLTTVADFVDIFRGKGESDDVIRASFIGAWPETDGRAPFMVIRQGGTQDRIGLLEVASRVAYDGGGF